MRYRLPGWQTITLTAVVALFVSGLMAFARPVELRVDGQRVESDVPPVTTIGDKVYVPLRSLGDALGAQIEVDGDRIYLARGNQSLRVRIGDTHAKINGEPFTFKQAPFRVRGRVMVGLKAVARAFDVRVNYDKRTARIDVLTPGIGEAETAQQQPSAE